MELLYEVVVRNEVTSEVRTVRISSFGPEDAQVEALVQLFKSQGWRKAVALAPSPVRLPAQPEVTA